MIEYVQKQISGFVIGLVVAGLLAVGLMGGSAVVAPSTPVAFEPGTGFKVADYCKTAKTVAVVNTPGAEVVGTRRVARNTDLDYVEWLDNNANTSATRYYVDKQGQPQHEIIDVEGAVPCLRTQR